MTQYKYTIQIPETGRYNINGEILYLEKGFILDCNNCKHYNSNMQAPCFSCYHYDNGKLDNF